MIECIRWGNDFLLEVFPNEADEKCKNLLNEFQTNQRKINKSHKIAGRWENQYLQVDSVPSARFPMRTARDLGKIKLGISSMILFDSPPGSPTSNPPFWFNVAGIGESTGLHDHAQLSVLSGVFYLQAEEGCGDLYFKKEGEMDLTIKPQVGKLVVFPPYLRHGVHPNKSSKSRISFAFNLFPFPLIQPEI